MNCTHCKDTKVLRYADGRPDETCLWCAGSPDIQNMIETAVARHHTYYTTQIEQLKKRVAALESDKAKSEEHARALLQQLQDAREGGPR